MFRKIIKWYFSLLWKIDTCLSECMDEVMKENKNKEEVMEENEKGDNNV